ncbi:uncharacterized protein Dana_GF11687, isoform B [Drosophila ananassae]|uniref:Uncharacterized protein, isoform B n=1 Tax=Drosophila ananassae TaxID=7217 RepID=A0A0P9BYT6_DROAN|nr:uncharacterized protein LOC6494551 [Drosophila ananassae]KPU76533.1 uncharacterized protein Dana_GF11687, isoform B [Drosophila ananassae]
MFSKAVLLLAAILASRCFDSGSSRRTLAVACEDEEEEAAKAMDSTAELENNRYSNGYSSASNNNNYKYGVYGDVDGIADSNESDNNDNYNYNKAPAKWQQQQQYYQQQQQHQQQKVYGYPIQSVYDSQQQHEQQQQQQHEQQQQQQEQQEQGLGEFDDDPENARNDFRLQLSDLNAAVQGVGRFDGLDHDSRNSNNYGEDTSNWQDQLLLTRRSRNSNISQRTAEDDERLDLEPGQAEFAGDDGVDIEGEEDYAVAREGQDEEANELSAQLPYGIQNVRKRRVRSVMPPPQHLIGPNPGSDGVVTYQSLCPTNRVTIKLDSGEYRPNHYVEVTCANNYAPLPSRSHNYEYGYRGNELLRALLSERGEKREICSATGFSCIQLNRTIHLIRLNEGSGCWESETRTVPSGCECMWPKHSYGDIAFYHQAQKKRGGASALRPHHHSINVDYKPGVGYRQLTLRTRNPSSRIRRQDLGYDNYEFK